MNASNYRSLILMVLIFVGSVPWIASMDKGLFLPLAFADGAIHERNRSAESLAPTTVMQSSSFILTWPIHAPLDDRSAMSQGFAFYNFIKSKNPFHTGLDLIHARATTAVFPAATGEIVKIQENDVNCGKKSGCFDHGMGNTVIVRHSIGGTSLFTQYSHLDSIPVNLISACGDSPVDSGKRGRHTCSSPVPVNTDTEIGKVGQSGQGDAAYWATPHLHFELKENPYIGASSNTDDLGEWGYTSKHPHENGFHDPIPHFHNGIDFSAPQLSEVVRNTVLKYGPGGSGNSEYRSFNLQLGVGQKYEALRSAVGSTPSNCSSGQWYEIRPPADGVFKVGGDKRVGSGWVCSNAVTGVTPPATVSSNATLDGQPWTGLIDFTIVGPSNVLLCPAGGCTVPTSTANQPAGQYTFSYNSGGPPSAAGPTISPSDSQTLSAGGNITFTMNFVSATPTPTPTPTPSPSPSPSPSPAPSPSPISTIELLPYQSSGYRYQVIGSETTPPLDFEQPNFDDTTWSVGTGAFGFGVGFCPLHSTDHTTWPVSTDLLVRRNVNIPAGTSNLRIMIAVDNDIVGLFFNGVLIASGVDHADCPNLDDFHFDVPQNLVHVGQNTVAFHLHDRGFESFFDTRILGNQSTINSSWVERLPIASPPARQGPGIAYDGQRQETVLFGGVINTLGGGAFTNDTWVWDGNSWIQRFPTTSPPARKFHSMAYDPIRQKILLFGGVGNGVGFNDTWFWDGTNWSQQFPTTNPPVRDGQSMVYDAGRQEILMFGGTDLNDTWVWNGSNWIQRLPLTTPAARVFAGISYDTVHGQVILFGGVGNNTVFGDTWIWNGSTWAQATPAQSPQPRYSAAMGYDAARGETVLFGGAAPDNSVDNETWIWNGTTWTQRFPSSSPPPRLFSSITYDAAHTEILLFGGDSNAFTHIFLNDTWVWPK